MVYDARDTVTDATKSVLETIKANPVPAALVSLGLGWLIMSGRSSSQAARHAVHRVSEAVGEARENPLALGALAIAIGAAIGLSLPHTHVEDEWMGEAKERLLRRAEGVTKNGTNEQMPRGDGSKSQAV
jgi:hypothetical protein